MDARAALGLIPVQNEHRGGYDRDLFGVWSDLDHDGCDTRVEVLIAESTSPPTRGPSHCDVIAGRWVSAYDGRVVTDPAALDIDHLVPLKEAWDSGAFGWSADERIAYANDQSDPRTLVAVSASANREKGDKDPSNWLPTADDVCTYIGDWIAVKLRWALSMDQSEWGRIDNLLRDRCAGMTIVAPPSIP